MHLRYQRTEVPRTLYAYELRLITNFICDEAEHLLHRPIDHDLSLEAWHGLRSLLLDYPCALLLVRGRMRCLDCPAPGGSNVMTLRPQVLTLDKRRESRTADDR